MTSKVEELKKKRRLKVDPVAVLIEEVEELKKKLEKPPEYELELNGSDFGYLKGDKGDKGGTGNIGKIGSKGDTGDSGQRGEAGERGVKGNVGRTGKQGLKGVQGQFGETGHNGLNGKPPKHEIAYNRIRFENPDGTWGEWLDIEKRDGKFGGHTLHRGGLDLVRDDLSSQCDGSTTTFTLTATPKADTVQLMSTQFPIIYRPTIDFTVDVSANTVSLVTSEVSAPKEFQTLVALYVKS